MDEKEQAEIDRLTTELADSKRSQAGSDKAVQRLQAENEQLVAQLESTTAGKDSTADQLAQATEKQDRRERVFKMAVDAKIDPANALKVLGLDGEDDETRLSAISDIQLSERQKLLKQNGRSIDRIQLNSPSLPAEVLDRMPADELKRLDPAILEDALEMAQPSKRATLRDRLTARTGNTRVR